MSQTDLDRLREGYAAYNRGDFEAAAAMFHPDAEWHPYLGALEGEIYRGRDAIVAMWRSLEEGFGGSLHVEILELIGCGEDVVAIIETQVRGERSGIEVRQTWAQVAKMRDGLVQSVRPYPDRAAALAAVGAGGETAASD